MKKAFVLCSIICLVLLTITSCQDMTTQNTMSPVADAYRNAAQNLIDSGDMESAILALKEGVEVTGDETLNAMLSELILKNPNLEIPSETVDEILESESATEESLSETTDETVEDITSVEEETEIVGSQFSWLELSG